MTTGPRPFVIHVPDEALRDLRERLARVRFPDVSGAGWQYGSDLGYMKELIAYWRDSYDWRRHEAELNTLRQFTIPLACIELHFIHEQGRGPRPLPLLLSHGWPGSVWEFHKLIPLLTDPARFGADSTDAFTVVAPSLPGYGFSFSPGQPRYSRSSRFLRPHNPRPGRRHRGNRCTTRRRASSERSRPMLVITTLALVLASFPAQSTSLEDSVLAPLRQQAKALGPLAHSDLARQFLAAAAKLPTVRTRTIYRDSTFGTYFRQVDVDTLPVATLERLVPTKVDALYYYQTHYGTVVNYLRVIDLLGANGITTFESKRLLDFGYGRIGHLRAIASLGATAVGVDVDPELPALYGDPDDQGPVAGATRKGSVAVVTGSFPGDRATRRAVGGAYDLVISKNTLKGGHEPAQRASQSRVINLGVPDSTFVHAVFDCMSPGGLFLMYTISGPKGNPHCPFSEDMVRNAGFEIVAYDQDDSDQARAMLRVLHRDQEGVASDEESTALFTILRKPH